MCCSVDLTWWRQSFVLLAACIYSWSAGVMAAFPSALNPAILSPNSTDIRATSSEASWIASINGISGFFGFFIFSPIFQTFGRKAVNIGLNSALFIGWIALYMANSVPLLLLGRAIQGLCVGGVFISAITLSEYTSPKRRGYFVTFKKVLIGLGSLVCHSLALVCTWRQISIFCSLPIILAVTLIFLWPESPSFLAMKGRFEECEKAFLWLNGDSENSRKELKELIKTQMERRQGKEKFEKLPRWKKILGTLRNKEVQKACLIVSLITLSIDACGRYFLLAYITQILQEITGSQSVAMYCSVVSDLLLIFALTISCFIIRIFNRRTLLFSFGSLTVLLMFIISLTVALKSQFSLLSKMSWLTPCLILLHTFIAHVGIVPVAFTISGEVFPLEHRGLCSFISGIVFTIFYAATLKVTPVMIEHTGVAGTYAIYAVIVAVCLAILFKILPETKDKTLQEIENEMRAAHKSDLGSELLPERGPLMNT